MKDVRITVKKLYSTRILSINMRTPSSMPAICRKARYLLQKVAKCRRSAFFWKPLNRKVKPV